MCGSTPVSLGQSVGGVWEVLDTTSGLWQVLLIAGVDRNHSRLATYGDVRALPVNTLLLGTPLDIFIGRCFHLCESLAMQPRAQTRARAQRLGGLIRKALELDVQKG